MGERFLIEEGPREENVFRSKSELKKLVNKKEANKVLCNGKKVVSETFVLFFADNTSNTSRYAIYIKKKFGLAVERNRAKRIIRASLQHLRLALGERNMIIIPRKKMKDTGFWQVVGELQEVFSSTGIFKRR